MVTAERRWERGPDIRFVPCGTAPLAVLGLGGEGICYEYCETNTRVKEGHPTFT